MSEVSLPLAVRKFGEAVARLCQPQFRMVNNRMVSAPSLYGQLSDAAPRSAGQSKVPAKSLPPVWIDAVQLKQAVDRQVQQWSRRPRGDTPGKLEWLRDRGWRPQDATLVFEMAGVVAGWAGRIEDLIEPEARKHITAPCPSCGAKWVYRRDSGGDVVRQPALELVTEVGCSCLACDAHWAPPYYLHLCRLLGFSLPEGVLD
jgi:hypothetical protein